MRCSVLGGKKLSMLDQHKTMFCRNFNFHLWKNGQHFKIYLLTFSSSALNGNQALGMSQAFRKTWDDTFLTKLREIYNILVLDTAKK